jgi:hypothetical protein
MEDDGELAEIIPRLSLREVGRFAQWVAARHYNILPNKGAMELLRYRYAGTIGLITMGHDRAQRGEPPVYTFRCNRQALLHVIDFRDEEGEPSYGKQMHVRRGKLLKRDGFGCCFCGLPLGDDMTIEHWLSRSRGGTNEPGNLALAHNRCNAIAADVPIMHKIRIRQVLRFIARSIRSPSDFPDQATVYEMARIPVPQQQQKEQGNDDVQRAGVQGESLASHEGVGEGNGSAA